MDTTRVDLNLLLTLEALLSELNVTKAANRLHLSQPAVSAQLNRLRELFNDPLLLPGRRGMTPTAKALDLLAPLRASLDQLRSTLHDHRDFYPERAEMTVTIACTDYIEAAIVAPLALALRSRAPGLRIAVRHYQPAQLEQQLQSGEVDIALATPGTDHGHLRSRHLFDESYVLIGRRGHPSLQGSVGMDDFVRLEHVVVSPAGGSFTTPIDEALAAFGHRRKVVMSAASFLLLPRIVASSGLVALAPRRLLQGESARLSIVALPWLAEQFEVSLLWHERSHGHAGQRWVRELIVELNAAAHDE